jgi:hypothetical protein
MTDNLSKFLTEARARLDEEQFWADAAAGRIPAHVAALRPRLVVEDGAVRAFSDGFRRVEDWLAYFTSKEYLAERNLACLGEYLGDDSSSCGRL